MLAPHSVFVLHPKSKTWQGLDECLAHPLAPGVRPALLAAYGVSTLIFDTREAAEEYISSYGVYGFQAVEVTLITPAFGDLLDEATQEKLDNLLPR